MNDACLSCSRFWFSCALTNCGPADLLNGQANQSQIPSVLTFPTFATSASTPSERTRSSRVHPVPTVLWWSGQICRDAQRAFEVVPHESWPADREAWTRRFWMQPMRGQFLGALRAIVDGTCCDNARHIDHRPWRFCGSMKQILSSLIRGLAGTTTAACPLQSWWGCARQARLAVPWFHVYCMLYCCCHWLVVQPYYPLITDHWLSTTELITY